MCGSETFEMLVSSSSMNVAIVTVSAIAHRLCAGTPAPCDSPCELGGAAVRDEISAAIPLARPTFQDADGGQGPGRTRVRFVPAAAALPLHSCPWRFPQEAG